jgi:hypothetical protein
MVGVAIVGAAIAALWSAVGLYLGKRTEEEQP